MCVCVCVCVGVCDSGGGGSRVVVMMVGLQLGRPQSRGSGGSQVAACEQCIFKFEVCVCVFVCVHVCACVCVRACVWMGGTYVGH